MVKRAGDGQLAADILRSDARLVEAHPRSLPGGGWISASGIVGVIAGIALIAGCPADTVWLLGMVLAVDLTFQGATAIGLGFALKQITK